MRSLTVIVVAASLATSSLAGADALFTGLGDLDGGSSFSEAFGISADGSVVAGRGSSDLGSEAFMWTAEDGMGLLMRAVTRLGGSRGRRSADLRGWRGCSAAESVKG